MEVERSAGVVGKKKWSASRRKKGDGIKVVYISNPMKVKASASEFRALVQELTGQDSDPAEMMAKLLADSSSSPTPLPQPPAPNHHHPQHTSDEDDDEPPAQNNYHQAHDYYQRPSAAAAPGPVVLAAEPSAEGIYMNCPNLESSTSLDDLFAPQMVESFNGFFPSSLFYESQMEMLRSLDAV